MRILLADTRAAASEALRCALREAGFALVLIENPADIASFARREDFDVIVVVVPPPAAGRTRPAGIVKIDSEPAALLRLIRRAGITAPIIVVGGGHRIDPIPVLRAGADDVVNPPFEAAEIAIRCTGLLRRARGFSTHELSVGDLTLDPEAQAARVEGRNVALTGREFALLRLLVLRRGQVVRKDAILNNLYAMDGDEPDGKIIDVFVCKLRRKLAAAGAGNLISTIWGVGYRLDAPVGTPVSTPIGTPVRAPIHSRAEANALVS